MIEFIKSSEKSEIMEKLKEHYGIKKLNYLLLRIGRERIRGYTGSLSKDEILTLSREVRIEMIGMYLMKQEGENIRLSFDSTQMLEINNSIIEISDEQTAQWLRGEDIFLENKEFENFVVLKNRGNFLGCGKLSKGRITNYVPKERRIKG